MPKHLTISDMQIAAKYFGGKCLSEEYISNTVKLKWMCAKGHTWDGTYQVVQRGIWCVQCINEERINAWKKELLKIIKKKGAKCLTETFVNQMIKIPLQCKNGHLISMRPLSVLQGNWCKQCSKEEIAERALNRIKTLAERKNGRCLSSQEDYKGKCSVLRFECKKGHIWSFGANNIPRLWCAKCRHEEK